MHPSFEIDKVYEAEVEGTINQELLNKLSNGITLEDGKTSPAKVRQLDGNKVELTIHEGRKHQVKRMLEAVGLPVKKLHRSQYGPLNVQGLKPGQWRDLSEEEILQLQEV
jgi:23S rRNA pseudouridine2605 synthase